MEATIKALSNILKVIPTTTDEIQNMHWNVKGPNFQAIHGDTGAVYSLLLDWTDTLAERIKALDPSYQVSKGSSSEIKSTLPNELDVINRVISVLTQFSGLVKTNMIKTDAVTSNQLQGLVFDLDKWIWKFTNSKS